MKTGSDFAGRNQTVVCSQCQFHLQVLVRIHWITTLKYVCPYRWNIKEIPILFIKNMLWWLPSFSNIVLIFCKLAHVKLLFCCLNTLIEIFIVKFQIVPEYLIIWTITGRHFPFLYKLPRISIELIIPEVIQFDILCLYLLNFSRFSGKCLW